MDFPILAYIGLSYACNMRCLHCYAKNKARNQFLTFEEIKSVIDELEEMFTCTIILGHGEPFLYPKILEVLEYIKNKKLNSVIMTNGSLIDNNIAERLREIKPLSICVSLDSVNQEIHDRIRQSNGAWIKAKNALLLLKEKGLKVKIASTIDILDPCRSFDLIEFTKQYNLDGIDFLTIRNESLKYHKKSISKYIEALHKLIATMITESNFKIKIHDPLILSHIDLDTLNDDFRDQFIDINRCTAGTRKISILPDGTITPCNLAPLHLGNIRTDSIANIWNESELLHKIRNSKTCFACPSSDHCQGGCLAFRKLNGEHFNRDNRCNF